MSDKKKEVPARHGEKMIEVKIQFWTNDLASQKDHVIPKHAWTSGVVHVKRNDTHGIEPNNPIPFHTLMDIPFVIEKVLLDHEITLHPSRKLKKYLAPQKEI